MDSDDGKHSRFARSTYVVNAKLHENDHVSIDDWIFAVRPGADTSAAARLVRVLSAAVQLVVAVADGVDVVV